MSLSHQLKMDSTHDGYGNQIEMQLPTITDITENTAQTCKRMRYSSKIMLQNPHNLEQILEMHNVEHQAKVFLKDLPETKHFTLTLLIEESEDSGRVDPSKDAEAP